MSEAGRRPEQIKAGTDDRMARADQAELERVRAMTPSERLAEAKRLGSRAPRIAEAPKRGEGAHRSWTARRPLPRFRRTLTPKH